MNNWWKAPVLQGEDNDYGQYDYLIEELPQDYAKWEVSKYRWRCDNCGKESHVRFTSAHYFYCWDGWDSMHWNECWRCRLKGSVRHIIWKCKKKAKDVIETIKLAMELCKGSDKNFKHCYNLAKKIVK